MATGNRLYPSYRSALLAQLPGYDLDNDTVADGPYAALIRMGEYVYNPAHQFYSQLTGVVGNDQRIKNPTTVGGIFRGDNLAFPAITGKGIVALIVYRHNSGPPSGWPLVMYYDQRTPDGLAVMPNGGNINVEWNVEGIFIL